MANEFKIRKGLIVEGATGGTVVDVQGSLGQLFSVTDNLTGEIFAVADISGVPIMSINSSSTTVFTGLVSGITPVAAANFVTKAYVDGSGGGTGPFLPLAGGTLTGNLTGTTISLSGGITANHFRTNAGNTDYNLFTRDNTGNTLFVQAAQSNTNQPIAKFSYGSATVNAGTAVLQVSKDNSHFVNCNVGIGDTSPNTTLQVSTDSLTNNVAAQIGDGFVGNDLYHKEGGFLLISGTSQNGTQTGAGIAFQTRNNQNTNYWKSSMIMDRDGAIRFTLGGAGTVAGSEDFTILSNGNIGIGETGPAAKLHIIGSGGNGGILFNNASSQEHRIYSTTNTQFNLIGSSSPIWVFGQSDVSNNLSGTAALNLSKTGATFSSNVTTGGQITVPSGYSVNIGTSRIHSTSTSYLLGGNVGIGVTGPQSKLHVAQAGNVNGGSILMGATGSGTTKWSYLAGAHFNQSTGSGNGSGSAGIALIGAYANSTANNVYIGGSPYELNAATSINFWTNPTNLSTLGGVQRMQISGAGMVTFNTYSGTNFTGGTPAYLLSVDASGNIIKTNTVPGSGAGPYLPLSAGSGFPLTGTLYGTSTNFSGNGDYAGSMILGNGIGTAEASLTIGQSRTDSGFAYIDLVGGTTYTDYGFRMLRGNTGANALSVLIHRGTGKFEIKTEDAAPIVFETTNAERVRIDSTGLVGIGTSFSQTRLQTNLAITGTYLGYLNGTASTFDMSANIAVVHNSPAIGTGTGAGLVLANNDKSIGAPSPIIAFSAKSASNSYNHTYAAIYGIRTATGADTNWTKGDIVLATGQSTGPIERMRITSAGNVGIGVTGPRAKLHVEGDKSYSLGYLDATSDLHIGNDTMSSAVGAYSGSITFGSTNESSLQAASIVAVQTGTDPNEIGLAFFTQHSPAGSSDLVESMRIKNDGNVGIGTTTPLAKLDIQGTQGQLFSVTDDLSGEIFAVSDISGVPIMSIDTVGVSPNNIPLTIFEGEVAIASSTSSGNAYTLGVGSTSFGAIFAEGKIFTTGRLQGTTGVFSSTVRIGSTLVPTSGTMLDVDGTVLIKDSDGVSNLYLGNYAASKFVRFHTNNTDTYFDMACGDIIWRQGSAGGSHRFEHDMTNGTFTASGDIVAYGSPSDIRLKENIKPIESALDKAMKLEGVTFDWKEKGITNLKHDIGFIAQDVKKVLPELVRENEDGMLSMRHQGITPILLEAIKELKAEIEELKKKIK